MLAAPLDPTKAKSREPAYSQALNQNKIEIVGQDPESQAGRQSESYGRDWRVFGVETGEGGIGKKMNQDRF